MVDEPPINGNLALAVGELKGAVTGLATMLDNQNKTSSEFRKEIMEIFRGMRDDNKQENEIIQQHIKEDNIHHQALLEIMTWKKDAEPKVDNLWDRQNTQKGLMIAVSIIASIIGGGIMAVIEWVKK